MRLSPTKILWMSIWWAFKIRWSIRSRYKQVRTTMKWSGMWSLKTMFLCKLLMVCRMLKTRATAMRRWLAMMRRFTSSLLGSCARRINLRSLSRHEALTSRRMTINSSSIWIKMKEWTRKQKRTPRNSKGQMMTRSGRIFISSRKRLPRWLRSRLRSSGRSLATFRSEV